MSDADTERTYSYLFDISPFPAVVSRIDDHTVLAVNARASEIVGVPLEEAIGASVTEYYVDPAQRVELAERLQRDGRADGLRLHIKRRAGEPFWALASSRLINWRGIAAVLTVFHDITAQVEAEDTLKANERRLVAQSDALTELTARSSDAGERLDDRLCSILTISARALVVERLSLWRFDEARAAIRCLGLFRLGAGTFESGATLHRTAAPRYFAALDGERVIAASDAHTDPRTAEFSAGYLQPYGIGAMLDVPLRHARATVGVLCAEHVGGARVWTVDEQNFAISVANLVAAATAEDDRRRAVARLAESEARARLVVDTAHDAFIGIDSAGLVTEWNVQAERTFGWRRDEVLGRNLADTIIPPAYREAHTGGMRRFHETGAAPVVNQRLELSAVHRSGREFPIEITITSPMPREGGYLFGAFLRDITDRRERDAELRRAKESAEAATRAKSEFLANMSHELRTPLNGVIGYAQLLQRDRTITASQREAIEAIAKCGSQLLDLINDVLDLSKIEAGRLDIETAPTDLAMLVAELETVVAEAARRKGLRLSMMMAPGVPASAMLDARHLRQALLNLLGNAVKFTAAGSVDLRVSRPNETQLFFEVVDTGIGIEPEALTEIFGAFAQTKAGAAAGGTGLGLAIADHLIRKMGGTLAVESTLGQGSRFFFSLPLVAAGAPGRPKADEPGAAAAPLDAHLAPGERVSALVVDDSPANRRILASLLESAGVHVTMASGGLEAVALAKQERPDIIFMDLKMDDLDGLEATRRIRRDPETARIPIVAVTASAIGNVRQTARDAGCIDYLSKPVRAPLLFGMLQTHLGTRLVSAATPVPTAATPEEEMADPARRRAVGHRLRTAVALGDVGQLQALAAELADGPAGEAAVGAEVSRLASAFDFAALGRLADRLTSA